MGLRVSYLCCRRRNPDLDDREKIARADNSGHNDQQEETYSTRFPQGNTQVKFATRTSVYSRGTDQELTSGIFSGSEPFLSASTITASTVPQEIELNPREKATPAKWQEQTTREVNMSSPTMLQSECSSLQSTGGEDVFRLNTSMQIRKHYRFLKEQLDPMPLVDFLISLDQWEGEYDEIQSYRIRAVQVDFVLQNLLLKEADVHMKFIQFLFQNGYSHVASRLNATLPDVDLSQFEQYTENCIESILSKYMKYLAREIPSFAILDILMECDEIAVDDYQDIFEETKKKKHRKSLLRYIRERSNQPRTFHVFLYALEVLECHAILKNILSTDTESDCEVTMSSPTMLQSKCSPLQSTDSVSEVMVSIECTQDNKPLIEVNREAKFLFNSKKGEQLAGEFGLTKCKCQFKEATSGSIILHFKPYGTDSLKMLQLLCKTGQIPHYIHQLMSNADLVKHLPKGTITQHISIVVRNAEEEKCSSHTPCKKQSLSECIGNNLSFLIEELDSYTLLKSNNLRRHFTDEEISHILQSQPLDRVARTSRFFNLLSKKETIAAEAFYHTLKEQKKTFVLESLMEQVNREVRYPGGRKQLLVNGYQTLVEEIDPTSMKHVFITKQVLSEDFFSELDRCFGKNERSHHASMLILKVLQLGEEALITFFDAIQQSEIHLDILHSLFKHGFPGIGTHYDFVEVEKVVRPADQTTLQRERKIYSGTFTFEIHGKHSDKTFLNPKAIPANGSVPRELRNGYEDLWKTTSGTRTQRRQIVTEIQEVGTEDSADEHPENSNLDNESSKSQDDTVNSSYEQSTVPRKSLESISPYDVKRKETVCVEEKMACDTEEMYKIRLQPGIERITMSVHVTETTQDIPGVYICKNVVLSRKKDYIMSVKFQQKLCIVTLCSSEYKESIFKGETYRVELCLTAIVRKNRSPKSKRSNSVDVNHSLIWKKLPRSERKHLNRHSAESGYMTSSCENLHEV